jgi:osmotically-inducible protein OsmY
MTSFIGSLVCAAALIVGVTPGFAAPQTTAAAKPSALDARISQRLKADPTLKKYDIGVHVDGTVATLSGTVPTEADRSKAGELAKVNGITRVDNQIVVDLNAGQKGTSGVGEKTKQAGEKTKEAGEKAGGAAKKGVSKTGEAITDTWITTRVKADYFKEDALKNSDIHVETNNHVVTLTGTVPTPAGRTRAVAIAKGIEGVNSVVDRLTIGEKK